MGCGASKAWSGAAYSTTMLKKFHQQAAVAELEKDGEVGWLAAWFNRAGCSPF